MSTFIDDNDQLVWVIGEEDKMMCGLCDAKIWDSDWAYDQSAAEGDPWDLHTIMHHLVLAINEHFKEKHKR
jgi:hypothetical protein